MLKIVRSPQALKDAQNIWLYTYKQWGESQANSYLNGLDDALKVLAENPKLGVDISYLQAGYFRYRYQRHLIVYRLGDKALEVMRILHERMDIVRHKLQ